ncbi:hypothetical protein GCM10028816_50810 [Spirosoma lituiforme]
MNDTWLIQNIDYHQPCKMQIVNRWGNIVYEQSQYEVPWNAEVNGVPVESGLYHYVLRTPYVSYSGSIQIIR